MTAIFMGKIKDNLEKEYEKKIDFIWRLILKNLILIPMKWTNFRGKRKENNKKN